MKTPGAALLILALVAGRAAAQIAAPTPLPVPTDPKTTPSRLNTPVAPAEDIVSIEGLVVAPQRPIPPLRIPTSFDSLYSVPTGNAGYIDPRKLNGTAATCTSQGCVPRGDGTFVCGPVGRIWGDVDYVFWQATADRVPVLVTTSPIGTATAQAGVLGAAGTSPLFGGTGLNGDYRSGVRYNVGVWFDPEQMIGIQTGGFFLGDESTNGLFTSNGSTILARPIVNASTGLPISQLVAFPDTVGGSVGVSERNAVYGLDAALRGNMCCGSCWRLDALLGYRYLRISDDLAINENLVVGANGPTALGLATGTNIASADRFHTSNTFNGVQAGITGEYRFWERMSIGGTAKASFGWIDEVVDIAGASTFTVPGGGTTQLPGGLLALSSNIGRSSSSHAVIIPELNLNLGFQLMQNVRLRAGYSLLYISQVARPGDVIDTSVNTAIIPPSAGNPLPARPTALNDRNDFLLQGFNAGLEVRY